MRNVGKVEKSTPPVYLMNTCQYLNYSDKREVTIMAKKIHTDDQYIMIVRNEVVITISEVAEKLQMSVRNTTKRLRKLAADGKLTEKRIETTWHFSLPEESK